MLKNIRWQGYWITLALFNASYYLGVYLRYYRKEIPIALFQTFRRKGLVPVLSIENLSEASLGTLQMNTDDEFEVPSVDSEEGLVYTLMDELTAYLEEARRTKAVKPDLVYSLQKIFSKYPTLKSSSFKELITKVFVCEAEHICSVHLSEEDISKLWKGG